MAHNVAGSFHWDNSDTNADYVHAEATVPTICHLNAIKGSDAAQYSAAPV